MTVHITEAPRGTIPHLGLSRRLHLDRKSVLVHLRPYEKTAGGVALDLLAEMGKDFRVIGGNSVRTDEHRIYAPIWLHAHDVQTVALLDAQQVRPAAIHGLLDLCPPSVDVVLVCEPGYAATTRLRLQAHDVSALALDWDDWLSQHEEAAATSTAEDPESQDGYGLDHLPRCHCHTFRYWCRELNTAERFTSIDADYTRAYARALDIPATPNAAVQHLDEATASAASNAPLLVALNATQSAFFSRGHVLHAHPDRVWGLLACSPAPRPRDRDWRVLRAYTRPERAATAALYLLGLPTTGLRTFSVEAARAALADGYLAGRVIPEHARPLLTAQLLRRDAEGAAPADSFLDLTGARRHLEILIDARRDLGLPMDTRSLRDDTTSNPTRLLHRLRLEVRSIA